MSIADRMILLEQDLKMIKCDRCGLSYNPENENCPHCKNLNDMEVSELIERIGIDQNVNEFPWSFVLLVMVILLIIYILSEII